MAQTALDLVPSTALSAPALDRRVALIEIKHLLDMVLEAGNEDGYTDGELVAHITAVEARLAQCRQLLVRQTDRPFLLIRGGVA